jgi:HK97 family phage prohead protease
MEHLLLKAATTATDEGVFEAVISTATVDREKDIVEPQAMVNALQKWAALGKLVPLAWAHTPDLVGSVDPSTVRVENGEVIAKGQIDQNTPLGEESWRLVKSGTLSFSFGYLIPKGGATKRPGGRLHIKELDLFEISVVPVLPANNDTRVLSFKDAEKLRGEAKRVEREVEEQQIPELPPREKTVTEPVEDKLQTELQEVKARLDTLEKALEDQKTKTVEAMERRSVDPLRQQAEGVALDIASGGLDRLPKRQAKAAPEPDLVDLDELKRKSRDLMLQVLSGME